MQSADARSQMSISEPLLLTPSLQGLRFIAAIFVFLGHMGLTFTGANGSLYFLVLSGYAVTRLLQREWQSTGRVDLAKFWKSRIQKLFPPFCVAWTITVIIKLLLHAPLSWSHALSMLIFVGNYYNAFSGHPLNGFSLYWTLSLLFQFYFFWPICFSQAAVKSYKKLKIITAAFVFLSLIMRIVLIQRGAEIYPYIYNSFETRADSLALGCLLGLFATPRFFERCRPWIAQTGIEPVITLFLLLVLGNLSDPIRLSIGFTLQSALICVLIAQMNLLKSHRWWKWLGQPTWVYLGSLSYLFYLFHGIGKSIGLNATHGGVAQSITGIISTLLIAALLKPGLGLKWITRFSQTQNQ